MSHLHRWLIAAASIEADKHGVLTGITASEVAEALFDDVEQIPPAVVTPFAAQPTPAPKPAPKK